jgi:hypothetical protein
MYLGIVQALFFCSKNKKGGQEGPRPPCLPLHQPSVFPGYLIYIFNTQRSPEKIKKKFLEQALACSRIKKGALALVYIVIAARTLLRPIC